MCPDFGLFHDPIVQILDFFIFSSPNFGLFKNSPINGLFLLTNESFCVIITIQNYFKERLYG